VDTLLARRTESACARRIGHQIGDAYRGLAVQRAEPATHSFLIGERRIKQRHAFDAAAIHNQRRRDGVDAVDGERFELGVQTQLAHLIA